MTNILTSLPFSVSTTLTRPANTTAYTAGDAITDSTSAPTALQFTGTGISGSGILRISHATIAKSGVNLETFQLWLFNSSPTATNDNAAFTLTDADNDACVGVLTFGTGLTAVNNSYYHLANLDVRIQTTSTSQVIYGLLKGAAGFTPVSAETFKITLKGDILFTL